MFITALPIEIELKDVDTSSRTIIQAYTKYDFQDADKDIPRRGMFAKTIVENKSRIKHLLNHNTLQPVGKPTDFYDEKDYAVMKSKIGSHKLGNDFLEMALSGLITEGSYGAQPMRYKALKGGGRELLESKLWEVSSLTHWGASEHTPLLSVSKEAANDYIEKLLKHSEKLEKFCRNSEASDETIETLLLENKQLTQLIISIKSTTPPQSNGTLPDFEVKDTIKQFIQSLN